MAVLECSAFGIYGGNKQPDLRTYGTAPNQNDAFAPRRARTCHLGSPRTRAIDRTCGPPATRPFEGRRHWRYGSSASGAAMQVVMRGRADIAMWTSRTPVDFQDTHPFLGTRADVAPCGHPRARH